MEAPIILIALAQVMPVVQLYDPFGITTVPPAGATFTAACTSDALPFVVYVDPRTVYALAWTIATNVEMMRLIVYLLMFILKRGGVLAVSFIFGKPSLAASSLFALRKRSSSSQGEFRILSSLCRVLSLDPVEACRNRKIRKFPPMEVPFEQIQDT
jgi:hypothetical protein